MWMAGSAWLLLPSDRLLLEVGDTLKLLETLLGDVIVVVLLVV